MVKSKKVIFRVSEPMFNFLAEFSRSVNMERSELMRKIVEHYFLMYFSDSSATTYEELKCRFLAMNPLAEQDIVPKGESKDGDKTVQSRDNLSREDKLN